MQDFRNDGPALDSIQAGLIDIMMAQRWGEYIVGLYMEAYDLMISTTATIALVRVSMKERMDSSLQFPRLRISTDGQYKMSYPAS